MRAVPPLLLGLLLASSGCTGDAGLTDSCSDAARQPYIEATRDPAGAGIPEWIWIDGDGRLLYARGDDAPPGSEAPNLFGVTAEALACELSQRDGPDVAAVSGALMGHVPPWEFPGLKERFEAVFPDLSSQRDEGCSEPTTTRFERSLGGTVNEASDASCGAPPKGFADLWNITRAPALEAADSFGTDPESW